MLKLLFLDKQFDLLAHADVVYPSVKGGVITFVARCPVVKSGSVSLIFILVDGLCSHSVLPLPSDSLEDLETGQFLTYSSGVDVTLVKKVNEHLKALSAEHYRVSNDRSTIVSTDIEWLPLETAPLGAKVWALTVGHVGLSTVLTRDTLKDFLGWYPIPREPSWVKGKGLGYPADFDYLKYTEDAPYRQILENVNLEISKAFRIPDHLLTPTNGTNS